MKHIPLKNRTGKIVGWVKVDNEDYETLNKHTWRLESNGYAARNVTASDGKKIKIGMHREIMGLESGRGKAGQGKEVDHLDHDRLNNQKNNLAIKTRQENLQNRNPKKRGTVYFYKRVNRWVAKARLHGEYIHLGYFIDKEDAIDALEKWRHSLSQKKS